MSKSRGSYLEAAERRLAESQKRRAAKLARDDSTTAGDLSEDEAATEALIRRKANGSLIYVILGAWGVAAIVFLPLAYVRSGQALRLIDEHHVGERYRATAKTTRALAAVIFLFWAAVALAILAGAVLSR